MEMDLTSNGLSSKLKEYEPCNLGSKLKAYQDKVSKLFDEDGEEC